MVGGHTAFYSLGRKKDLYFEILDRLKPELSRAVVRLRLLGKKEEKLPAI